MSATLALIAPSSAAHRLPLLQNTSLASLTPINLTGHVLEAPGEHVNLTFSPWPGIPFEVPMHGPGPEHSDVYLVIARVQRIRSWPMIEVPALQRFLRDFADNIKQKYPVPGFVPQRASSTFIDVLTYTTWKIHLYKGRFRAQLPTALALTALSELERMLGQYGPSDIVYGIRKGIALFPWAYGGFAITTLKGVSLNKPLSIGNGSFQTT